VGRDYAWNFMTAGKYARVFLVACVLLVGRAASAADEATLFRLFLKDGGTLVSYGEVARVGDRVVFSMPTSAGPNPPLHLVNIAADRVDWDRTDRYAASARSGRYLETQAENDYTLLSNQVSEALNEAARTDDPGRRLAIIEDARKTLAEWPSNHYNYREADIRQLLTMLDVAIADLRASSGQGRFALNLVGLGDRLKHYPRQLSGGQEQRVAIARAIVNDPKILVADEPTGDLDRKAGDQILDLLQTLNREQGKTIVMVTHDPHAAERARHVLHLDKGALSA